MSLIELKQVALDAANNKVQGNYSTNDTNEAIRAAMKEVIGSDQITYKQYRRMDTELFEFIEETVTPIVHTKLEELFARFAEVRNIAYGDQNKFLVPNTELFRVATIAEGSGNIRRKRLDSTEFEVELSQIAVGIYEEFNRFLAGRVDWAMYTNRIAQSFARDMAHRVSSALYGSFDDLGSVYAQSVASDDAAVKTAVLEVASHVEAENGNVIILGSKAALAKLKPEYYSDAQAGERNQIGYFGMVDGYEVMAIEQFHHNGTDDFAVDNKSLLILPNANEKIVKIVLEGQPIIREVSGLDTFREDMQVQFDMIDRAGVMVMAPNKYGMVKFA